MLARHKSAHTTYCRTPNSENVFAKKCVKTEIKQTFKLNKRLTLYRNHITMSGLTDKQLRILEVAETLFSEKGFDGTSIRDISRQAKVNIAMVSYYFGSKEKMLEALVLHRTSDLRLQLEHLMAEDLSPIEKIDRLVELYVRRVNRNIGIYRILQFEFSSNKRRMDLDHFSQVKKQNLQVIRQIVAEGQDKGVFRKDVEVVLVAPTLLGTYFHFQMNRKYFEQLLGLDTDEKFNAYVENQLTAHIKRTIKALLTQ